MLVVALIGLAVNLVAAWNLSRGGVQNMNLRAASAHVLADAAGSVAAIVAAVLILAVGWTFADPVTSILISLLIVVGSWRLLRDATNVLMEGAPAGLDVTSLERPARDAGRTRPSRPACVVDRRRRAGSYGARGLAGGRTRRRDRARCWAADRSCGRPQPCDSSTGSRLAGRPAGTRGRSDPGEEIGRRACL
jgi:hypothetical protein